MEVTTNLPTFAHFQFPHTSTSIRLINPREFNVLLAMTAGLMCYTVLPSCQVRCGKRDCSLKERGTHRIIWEWKLCWFFAVVGRFPISPRGFIYSGGGWYPLYVPRSPDSSGVHYIKTTHFNCRNRGLLSRFILGNLAHTCEEVGKQAGMQARQQIDQLGLPFSQQSSSLFSGALALSENASFSIVLATSCIVGLFRGF